MKYLVLRNCFTAECRYFRKGDIVELSDEMYKAEKNFRAVKGDETSGIEAEPETLKGLAEVKPVLTGDMLQKNSSASTITGTVPESTIEPVKDNNCPTCGRECKSAFGLKAHMKVHK